MTATEALLAGWTVFGFVIAAAAGLVISRPGRPRRRSGPPED
ncbi:hypothetical protein GCM10020358_40240 [Amorphoplanes nipponensis]|uniref:Uncharacterized protein n=1 Tax=Actinoplanes nipponensis TaxID=135950 RepID=A0A919MQI6_9ACTN|nr:hypothetical protein [Actinoplanes nipponensis]GIE53691.1 hypothetical protein Ani05nite_72250 [Actinoplanes nipponensis]